MEITENPKGYRCRSFDYRCRQTDIEKYSEADIEKMDKRLTAQFKKGMTLEKIAKAYSLEELKLVAKLHEIEAEPNDTVETLLQALLEDFESSSKG